MPDTLKSTIVAMRTGNRKCVRCHEKIDKGSPVVPFMFGETQAGWCHAECEADRDPLVKKQLDAAAGKISDEDKREIADHLKDMTEEIGKVAAAHSAPHLQAALDRLSVDNEKRIATAIKNLRPDKIIVEIKSDKKTKVVEVEGTTHAAFKDALRMLSAGLNVFLPGPTGCGKTHMATQLAKSLDTKLYPMSVSGGTTEHHLLGRMIQNIGKGTYTYVPSPLIMAFINGGLALLDEMDAGDPNVLLIINSMIDNGFVDTPSDPDNPIKTRHANFRLIACANTFGNGADSEYVGRNQMDAATMSRFQMATLPMDYDPRVDETCCPDEEIRNHLTGYRLPIRENRIRKTVSTRTLRDSFKLKQAGYDLPFIEKQFFAPFTADEMRKVPPKLKSLWPSAN